MKRIPESTWAEIRTAYASGIGLRELARNMGIPAGTILARSKRERWTAQIANARALSVKPTESPTLTPAQAVAVTMRQRGERHVEAVARLTERTMPHLEAMQPGEVLDRIDDIETLDKVARRNFGLNDGEKSEGGLVCVSLVRLELSALPADAREV